MTKRESNPRIPDLIGGQAVRDILGGITQQAVSKLRARAGFPAARQLIMGPLYLREEIKAYAKTKPTVGRPRKGQERGVADPAADNPQIPPIVGAAELAADTVGPTTWVREVMRQPYAPLGRETGLGMVWLER